jgi:hypothetical protein
MIRGLALWKKCRRRYFFDDRRAQSNGDSILLALFVVKFDPAARRAEALILCQGEKAAGAPPESAIAKRQPDAAAAPRELPRRRGRPNNPNLQIFRPKVAGHVEHYLNHAPIFALGGGFT